LCSRICLLGSLSAASIYFAKLPPFFLPLSPFAFGLFRYASSTFKPFLMSFLELTASYSGCAAVFSNLLIMSWSVLFFFLQGALSFFSSCDFLVPPSTRYCLITFSFFLFSVPLLLLTRFGFRVPFFFRRFFRAGFGMASTFRRRQPSLSNVHSSTVTDLESPLLRSTTAADDVTPSRLSVQSCLSFPMTLIFSLPPFSCLSGFLFWQFVSSFLDLLADCFFLSPSWELSLCSLT